MKIATFHSDSMRNFLNKSLEETSIKMKSLQNRPEITSKFSTLKAHCRGADWINKTIKKKRIRQGSVMSLYCKIHEEDNDLTPFILKTKDDPRTERLCNYSKARALLLISTSQVANHNHDSFPLKLIIYVV